MRNQKGSRTWDVRHYLALMLALPLLVVGQVACDKAPPTAPQPVVVTVNVIQNQGGNPSASPAPGSSSGIASVTVNGFDDGELCPAGIQLANQTKTIRAGCKLAVTVNPRDVNGKVIHDTTVTGVAPDYFKQAGETPAASFSQDGGNPYNGMIVAKSAGTIVLNAAVKGVPSGDTTFTVIN